MPCALSDTEPIASRLRESVVSARWFAIVSASATPIAAVVASFASPCASVFAMAVWSALAVNEPVITRLFPAVTVAVVVMFEIAIATDGTIATLPPEAPVFARVVMPWKVVAVMVRLCPPISVPVSSAVVVSSTTATATDAPMPTEDAPLTPPVASSGSALVPLVASDAAATDTSPAPAFSQPFRAAVVWMFSISIATEPATPTAPPPAPLVADAPSVCRECMSAVIDAPFALTVLSGGARASLVMRT